MILKALMSTDGIVVLDKRDKRGMCYKWTVAGIVHSPVGRIK